MSRRTVLYILCGVVGVVILRYAVASNKPPDRLAGTPAPQVRRPFPAEEPTTPEPAPKKSAAKPGLKTAGRPKPAPAVSIPAGQTTPQETQPFKLAPAPKKSAGKPSPGVTENESSNITPDLRSRLERIVRLYASWPGTVPKKMLIRRLEMEKPFITSDAINRIKEEWTLRVRTVELTVLNVEVAPGFTASTSDPNSANAVVYVRLRKRFKPVSRKPYTKLSNQPYSVNLRIIKRNWTVVGITPQSASASLGG
jgi:hypothetical protein